MGNLENLARRNLITILLLLLLGGFAMLLVELWITNHTEGIQNVAVIASIVGAVALLAGFFARGMFRHLLVLLLLLLSLTGLLGAWEHFEEGREGGEARTSTQLAADRTGFETVSYSAAGAASTPQQEDEEGEENEGSERGGTGERGESGAPPLAPLSLSGLALMGAFVLLAKQDK